LQRQALSVRVLDYETLGEESGACGDEDVANAGCSTRLIRIVDARGPQPGPLQR
jgi:hypothetical protein